MPHHNRFHLILLVALTLILTGIAGCSPDGGPIVFRAGNHATLTPTLESGQ